MKSLFNGNRGDDLLSGLELTRRIMSLSYRVERVQDDLDPSLYTLDGGIVGRGLEVVVVSGFAPDKSLSCFNGAKDKALPCELHDDAHREGEQKRPCPLFPGMFLGSGDRVNK